LTLGFGLEKIGIFGIGANHGSRTTGTGHTPPQLHPSLIDKVLDST